MSVEVAGPAGSPEASGRSPALASGCLVLFGLPFAGVGVGSAVLLVTKLYEGDWKAAGFLSIFALLFGGAGAGVIVVALVGRREAMRRALAAERHPAEPWLWRADWSSGSIEAAGRKGQYCLWAFAAFWNLIAWPTGVLVIRAALEQGNRLALIGLLFPVVGLGLLVAAARATIRERKFGVSVLELATKPGLVGHGLAGTVRAASDALPTSGYLATLTCVNVRTTGSGKNRSTTETVCWQDQETVSGQRTASGAGRGIETTIPVRFRIPPDVAPTDDTNPSDRTVWRLQVTAAVPGVDYTAAFELPVFRTEKSLEPVTGDEEKLLGPAPESLPYQQPHESPIRVSSGPRGTQIVFPAARNPGAALGLSAFAALWGSVVWLLFAVKAGPFFIGVFGLVELAFIYGVLRMWLWVVEVTAGRDDVAIASGFVVVGEPARIPAADVAGVEVQIGMQAGSTVYYGLQIVRKDDRKATAGSGIRDKREAEWLAGLVKQAVGA